MLSDLRFEIKLLFRSVPGYVPAGVSVAVVVMNLLANKSVDGLPEFMALDFGFCLSWLSFLCMDMLTKHFGPKASIIMALFGLLCNLVIAAVLFICSVLPGTWGAFYDYGEVAVINQALDTTFGGTWYVLLGSSIAYVVAAIVNSTLNHVIGKLCKSDHFRIFALRSYVSTAIGQFVDNLIFAFIVSHTFFGWSLIQCIVCALTGMVIELLCEVIISPIGYHVVQRWKRDGVGKEYIEKYYSSTQ